MAQDSKIEWTNHTANLWHGCTKVHEGCDNCYAETLSKRWGNDVWGNDRPRKEVKSVWNELTKYQKKANEANEIHRVFVGSMMDIFEKPMPLIDSKGLPLSYNTEDVRQRFWKIVEESPNLMFLLLTKRPSNINKYIPEKWKEKPPTNVMFGTSPVNQETAEKLVSQLAEVKGKRFLSIEPQLGEIDLLKRPLSKDQNSVFKKEFYRYIDTFDWIIQGGESGHHKRPFNLDWAYSLKEQCEIAKIPYFFKQIDKIQEIPKDLMVRQFEDFYK